MWGLENYENVTKNATDSRKQLFPSGFHSYTPKFIISYWQSIAVFWYVFTIVSFLHCGSSKMSFFPSLSHFWPVLANNLPSLVPETPVANTQKILWTLQNFCTHLHIPLFLHPHICYIFTHPYLLPPWYNESSISLTL